MVIIGTHGPQFISYLSSDSHGSVSSRPGSPEPPELEDDDADEDTDPTEAAYSTTGTDTDGVETDNPEDYNPEDLEAAQKAFDENAKTKRDLFKRLPTAIRAILSASKRQLHMIF